MQGDAMGWDGRGMFRSAALAQARRPRRRLSGAGRWEVGREDPMQAGGDGQGGGDAVCGVVDRDASARVVAEGFEGRWREGLRGEGWVVGK